MATTSFKRAAGATTIPAAVAGKPVAQARPAAAARPAPTPPPPAEPVDTGRPTLTAPVNGGADFDPIPEGVYPALVCGVYDVGTHHSDKWGKDQRKVVLSFEIPGERIEIERDGELLNLPRVVSTTYTMSMNAKASLRRDVHALEGHALTDTEAGAYDLFNLAGRACQLQITHTVKDQRTFANVSAIMALPKGMPEPVGEMEPIIFTVADCDPNVLPEGMPGWIVEKAKACQELNPA